jgi:hypothetical protein
VILHLQNASGHASGATGDPPLRDDSPGGLNPAIVSG